MSQSKAFQSAEPVKSMKREKARLANRKLDMRPIVVTAGGVVVDGQVRLAAAQQLGMDEVPAIVVKHPDLRSLQSENC